jgi:hypothetical protein
MTIIFARNWTKIGGKLLSLFGLCTTLALCMGHTVLELCARIIHRSGIHNGTQIVPSGYIQVKHDQDPQHLLGSSVLDNSIKSSQ